MQFFLKRDFRQLDFVTIAPRQPRRFITKPAVPSQWRVQSDAPLFHKRDNMVRRSRLFRDDSPQESEENPRQKGSGESREKSPELQQKNSRGNKRTHNGKRKCEERQRRGVARDRRMQPQRDAARKGSGDRQGGQPHGTLRNLTSVSI